MTPIEFLFKSANTDDILASVASNQVDKRLNNVDTTSANNALGQVSNDLRNGINRFDVGSVNSGVNDLLLNGTNAVKKFGDLLSPSDVVRLNDRLDGFSRDSEDIARNTNTMSNIFNENGGVPIVVPPKTVGLVGGGVLGVLGLKALASRLFRRR